MSDEDACHLEVWGRGGFELVPLTSQELVVGRKRSNNLALPGDGEVSGTHAALRRYASGWCLADLGSLNGTFIRGERISGEQALRHGDEIRVGQTRLVFRAADGAHTMTGGSLPAPSLTPRQRDTLRALCRPVLDARGAFRQPATIKQIAAELVVTEGAVKQHLPILYDKFGLIGARRRLAELANEALLRGAVGRDDTLAGR